MDITKLRKFVVNVNGGGQIFCRRLGFTGLAAEYFDMQRNLGNVWFELAGNSRETRAYSHDFKIEDLTNPDMYFSDLEIFFKRQGHGTTLLQFADYMARVHDKTELTADVRNGVNDYQQYIATEFYKKLGFEFGEQQVKHNIPIRCDVPNPQLETDKFSPCECTTEIFNAMP